MAYVDVFLLPVLKAREAEYLKWAEVGKSVWMEHGAVFYAENRAEDVPDGKVTSLPMSVKLGSDEVLYFTYATYRDRAHRDEVNAKVMADPRVHDMMQDSPANMQRMIFGGFATVVSA